MALVDLTSVTTGSIGTNTNFIVEENKVLKRISQSSLLKTSAISTTQVNSTTNVPSSSLVYSMNQSINKLNSDMKDRSNIWSGSLELSSESQTINIASAENYNQILVIIKNAANNITVAIMIDRYLYNTITNIYYRVSDSSYHANIDIVPILASFEVRLEGEYTGAWTLVAVIGKI